MTYTFKPVRQYARGLGFTSGTCLIYQDVHKDLDSSGRHYRTRRCLRIEVALHKVDFAVCLIYVLASWTERNLPGCKVKIYYPKHYGKSYIGISIKLPDEEVCHDT